MTAEKESGSKKQAFAEAAQSVELKVKLEEEKEKEEEVSEKVSGTSSKDANAPLQEVQAQPEVAQPVAPVLPSQSEKPYPGMIFGLITSLFWLIFLFCVSVSYREYSKAIDANLFSSPFITLALTFLSANCFWFCNAYRNLAWKSTKYFPEASKGLIEKSLLTALLPLSLAVLFFNWIQQKLLFCSFPLVDLSNILVVTSLIYWLCSVLHFPLMLRRRFDELAWQKNIASEQPAFARRFIARRRLCFPSLFSAFMMLPLGGFTFILYWREALKGLEKLQAYVPEVASNRRTKAKTEDGRLVIRYRKFATIERFLHQRLAANRKLDKWKWWIIGGNALFFSIVGSMLFVYQKQFALWFTGTAGGLLTGGASSGISLNSFVLSNGMLLFLNALVLFSIGLAGYLFYRRQPTHYVFTALGFQSFRYRGELRVEEPIVLWSEVDSIRLVAAKDKDIGTQTLSFNLKSGQTVKLKLESIDSIEDKETVLKAIEKWAPGVHRDAAVIQALQPPVDHSYTELWLQALAAPPQRDRLKPLERDIVLADGRYRVRRALGVGGQGAAYEAQDRNTGEVVVLKEFLLPIYVDVNVRKEVLERFEGEARILKQLDNNQVVRLLDYFVEDHRAYLVLEHIDGLSLRETVAKEGPLSEERVRDLSAQMCKILSYLHSQDPPVVHRDFTPENLILRNDGLLKLIDFNVAKQVESTATGSVVGKPAYLPPEQFRGQPVCQSDIYGMGATLSFLLTGEEPEPISVSHPRKINTQVTSSLDAIVAKATAIEVKNRYQSADQLLGDLKLDYEKDGVESASSARSEVSEASSKTNDGAAVVEAQAQAASMQASLSSPQEAPLPNTAKFKEKEIDAEKIRLKVGEEASSGGMLVAEPEAASTKLYGEAPILSGTEKLSHKLPPGLRALISRGRFVTWLVSWFTVVLAFCFAVNADSISWFDPQADLHKHARIAVLSYLGGKYGDTVKESQICQKIQPDKPEGYVGEGLGLMDRSYVLPDDKVVYEKFARAAALEPDNKAYQFLRGFSAGRAGKYEEAQTALGLSMKLKKVPFIPEAIMQWTSANKQLNTDSRLLVAGNYMKVGNVLKALETVDKKEQDEYFVYREKLGVRVNCFELLHDANSALSSIDQAANEDWNKERLLKTVRLTRDALIGVEQAYKEKKITLDARNNFLEAMAYSDQSLYEKALEKFTTVSKLSPQYTQTYFWRAFVLWHLHRYDLALKDLDVVLKVEPTADAHYLRARTLQNLGRWQEAFDQYEKVSARDSDQSMQMLVYQGQCLAASGNYDRAIEYYDNAAKMNGGPWSRTAVLKARALCAKKQYNLALKALDEVEALHYNVDPYERALIYEASGNRERAQYYFAEAARRSPTQTPLPRLWIKGEPVDGPISDLQ